LNIPSRPSRNALIQARRQGWSSVVIVSHSFELLRNRKSPGKPLLPDRICVRRFEKLCRFLAEHPDDFRTATFAELDGRLPAAPEKAAILKSNVMRTTWRHAEQVLRRLDAAIDFGRNPVIPAGAATTLAADAIQR
jgi:hypothetical protein